MANNRRVFLLVERRMVAVCSRIKHPKPDYPPLHLACICHHSNCHSTPGRIFEFDFWYVLESLGPQLILTFFLFRMDYMRDNRGHGVASEVSLF